MELSVNPWLLTNKEQSSLYSVPFKLSSKKECFTDASHNRPAVLLFDSKKSAEKFRNNYLTTITVCNVKEKWSSTSNMFDASSFMEVKCKMELTDCDFNEERSMVSSTPNIIHTEKISDMRNDILMNLTICAYVVYFYVEEVTIRKDCIELIGLLINQRDVFSHDDRNYTREYIISHLNQMFLESKN